MVLGGPDVERAGVLYRGLKLFGFVHQSHVELDRQPVRIRADAIEVVGGGASGERLGHQQLRRRLVGHDGCHGIEQNGVRARQRLRHFQEAHELRRRRLADDALEQLVLRFGGRIGPEHV